MTTFGTLVEPEVVDALELIDAMPYGDLVTPFVLTSMEDVTATYPSRFPVPPTAGGFLVDVDFEMAGDRVSANFAGALTPEGDFLEPTTGQIWPR